MRDSYILMLCQHRVELPEKKWEVWLFLVEVCHLVMDFDVSKAHTRESVCVCVCLSVCLCLHVYIKFPERNQTDIIHSMKDE